MSERGEGARRPSGGGPARRGALAPSSARVADALFGLALLLAALGVALSVWRPDPRDDDLPSVVGPRQDAGAPETPRPRAPRVAGGWATLQDTVVGGNVFAFARRPPRARYRPPADSALDAVDIAPIPLGSSPLGVGGEDVGGEDGGERAGSMPQFYGTVVGPDGARALLRLDTRASGAQLYPAGARAGGWRVVRVEPERVVLAGARGRVTLRLPRPGDRSATDSLATDSARRVPSPGSQ